MSKCCWVTWLLIIASALWITGLTIGIIGAVNYAPLKPFLDNQQSSTCTLVEAEYKSKRCTKWGNCLIVVWESTYPSLVDPSVTATAWITEKGGLGYNDASKLAATRKAGDSVPCLIDKRNGKEGYFKRPGDGFLAELIIGWIFFFIGTFIWIAFFMEICCGVKFSKCRCSCSCLNFRRHTSPYKARSGASTTTTANPLYGGSTTTTTTTRATRKYSGSSSTPASQYSQEMSDVSEKGEEKVIPPANVDPTPYTAAGGAGDDSSGSVSSGSSSGDNYGAGAGYEN